ncbi:MAG TPA: O-methyltransferase [Thermomicrobiales bacterium]|nr:O-methyltransferase [Thermomicrobiales bacterium]
MSQERWTAVDHYFSEQLVHADPVMAETLRASDEAGLPAISVADNQGKLLMLLARMRGARAILEVGTLGGYSTIWLARALPDDGRLVTIEARPRHAEVARANLAHAGVADRVDVRLGNALQVLEKLHTEGAGPFDFVFLDADKANLPSYLEWSLKLGRPGTVIVADNVVRGGRVVDPNTDSIDAQGVRRYLQMASDDPRLETTAIQTVGAKGWDGFSITLVMG